MKSSFRPQLKINLLTIKNNYIFLRQQCGGSNVGAVVKASSYGLGVDKIAPVLVKSGCTDFFVSDFDEGVEVARILNNHKCNIYILNGVYEQSKHDLVHYNLIPVLNNMRQIDIWNKYALQLNKYLPCLIHVDTGMHRLGLSKEEAIKLSRLKSNLNILYIISHLSAAEEENNICNKKQLAEFNIISKLFPGIKKSLANSGGIFLGKDYHFDLVRPGAALYGINPTSGRHSSSINSPISLTAPIIQIQYLPKGESVGYNSTYTNREDKSCRIATVPIGYADGYCRHLSNKGHVAINGVKAPIIGRISMDLTIIDTSRISEDHIFLGQTVEMIGDNITLPDVARAAETNEYEVLTSLGHRYERVYINEKL